MARTKKKAKAVKTAAKKPATRTAASKSKTKTSRAAAPKKATVPAKAAKVAKASARGTARPKAKVKATAAKTSTASRLGRAVKGLAKVAGAATAVTVAASLAVKSGAKAKTDYGNLLSPLEDRLLVQVEEASERSAGGLIIPGTVAERPDRGRVVAVGPGLRNKKGQLRPLDVRVGETVLFAPSAGSKLTLAGSELLVIRESELLGVVG